MELLTLAGNPSRRRKLCVSKYVLSRYVYIYCFGRWDGVNQNLIQRSKQRYSNMLWNMWSITRHRLAEHFNSVLNRQSTVNENAINRLSQIECNVLLDEFPTVTETRTFLAIQQSSVFWQAPGSGLPLDTVSSGRESEIESAHLFLTTIQFISACHLTFQHTNTCIHN